jgi:hypothetical protein
VCEGIQHTHSSLPTMLRVRAASIPTYSVDAVNEGEAFHRSAHELVDHHQRPTRSPPSMPPPV